LPLVVSYDRLFSFALNKDISIAWSTPHWRFIQSFLVTIIRSGLRGASVYPTVTCAIEIPTEISHWYLEMQPEQWKVYFL
jgi:hypothetical protein